MTELPQVPAPQVRCMHLQSKAMAIHGEGFQTDADFQDGLSDCWCNMTGKPLGPDRDVVNITACCNPERDCHQEY